VALALGSWGRLFGFVFPSMPLMVMIITITLTYLAAAEANNLQQSWRFDWELPKAVLLKSSAQADPVAGRLVLGFGCRLGSLRPDRRS
jgi:hypothetical protein